MEGGGQSTTVADKADALGAPAATPLPVLRAPCLCTPLPLLLPRFTPDPWLSLGFLRILGMVNTLL